MVIKRNLFILAVASLFSTSAIAQDTSMSFSISSKGSGDGTNLGGLAGADMIYKSLATTAGCGDSPNQHDILTGSDLMRISSENTCGNWTSNSENGSGNIGLHDRQGGGEKSTSWNFAHPSRKCSQQNLITTVGNAYFYCFTANKGRII